LKVNKVTTYEVSVCDVCGVEEDVDNRRLIDCCVLCGADLCLDHVLLISTGLHPDANIPICRYKHTMEEVTVLMDKRYPHIPYKPPAPIMGMY